MSEPMRLHRPDAALRRGVTLIEASAGTGKTYNIASLFVRLVAEEDVPVDRILVVTFTEAATLELRTRLRRRLDEALEVVRGGGDEGDVGLAPLAVGDDATLAARARRLEAAARSFDRAFISTIHGFCQRMLALHAFECRVELERELVSDLGPLFEELVDDYRAMTLHDAEPLTVRLLERSARMNRRDLLELARAAAADRDAPLLPTGGAGFAAALGAFSAALAAFEARYRGGGREEARQAIEAAMAAKRLDGRRYQARYLASNLDKMARFLAEPTADAASAPDGFAAFFSGERLRASSKAGALVEHPFFDAWDAVREAASGVTAALHEPRHRFAEWVRSELPRRLGARGQQGFDDLVRSLAVGLAREPEGEALATGIRRRFDAALLDEFQDTDADQWSIFSRVFGDGERFLYLIGDPKQAIYAFRGADVHVYARAAGDAGEDRRFTMDVNQRSDGRYVEAMNALFGGREDVFDLDFVRYVNVKPAPRFSEDRVRFADGRAALSLRYFDGALGSAEGPVLGRGDAEALVPSLVAEDALECLESGEIFDQGAFRRVVPSDIAVLVRKNKQARAMQRALGRRGIPAVVGSSGSVFDSEEALLAERFLGALVDHGREGGARAIALSPLFGMSARALDVALNEAPDRFAELLDELALMRRALESGGVSRAFQCLFERRDLAARLAAEPEGERALTNLRHVVELLHRAESERRLGPEALLEHLRGRRRGLATDEEGEALRLESDDDAVRIVTLHKSKGLEYPIVFISHLWDGALLRANPSLLRFHDPDDDHRLALDLGLDTGDEAYARHRALAEREAVRENLRLAYVGFTRARHMAFAYFGPVNAGSGHASKDGYESSPLACLLHGPAAGPASDDYAREVRERVGAVLHKKHDDAARFAEVFEGDLEALGARSALGGVPLIDVTRCARPGVARYEPRATPGLVLGRRVFGRAGFDPVWGRHSYTGLLRRAEPHDGPAPEREDAWDEPMVAAPEAKGPSPVEVEPEIERPLPLADLRRGAEAGTFVHRVLEKIDFRDGREKRTGRPLAEAIAEIGRASGFEDPAELELLASALPIVLSTPLGDVLGDLTLDQIPPEDRLDEMPFDLPLGGGTRASSESALTAAALVRAMRKRAPDARVLSGYLEALEALHFPPVAGFLTGSIDLVFRAEVGGQRQYFVADYKTNSLGEGEPPIPTPSAYGLLGMRRAMEAHHYYLQYHLYLVALHRFLGQRLGSDYDYDRDVGGAVYLFVRGMLGRETAREGEVVRGVFVDKPPREVIEALSSAFEGPAALAEAGA